jgi:hypothetical protein
MNDFWFAQNDITTVICIQQVHYLSLIEVIIKFGMTTSGVD